MTICIRSILSVPILVLPRAHAVDLLTARLAARQPTRLAFANANLLNVVHADPELGGLLRHFMVLNDGAGVNLASRILFGAPFPDNLNGTDFCPRFLDAHPLPLRIYLLGGRPEVVRRAAAAVGTRWPQHRVVGFQHGFFQKEEFAGIREEIALTRPDMILVAMGNGRQERVVNELVPACAPLGLGVGALFDFLAGEVPRAPQAVRTFGAEWLYRLALEPARLWRRYIVGNPAFLWRVILQRVTIL